MESLDLEIMAALEVLVVQVVPLLVVVAAQAELVAQVPVHLHRAVVQAVQVNLQASPVHLLFMLQAEVVVSMEHPIRQTDLSRHLLEILELVAVVSVVQAVLKQMLQTQETMEIEATEPVEL
jgi:hypothetical protein